MNYNTTFHTGTKGMTCSKRWIYPMIKFSCCKARQGVLTRTGHCCRECQRSAERKFSSAPTRSRMRPSCRMVYTQYSCRMVYIYKGHPDEASTVVEAWLEKKKRTAGSMSSIWRTEDFRCKALADSFSVLPDVQWDAPAKLRVALWTPGDGALFILKVVLQVLSAGFSLRDERTGAWIDEREVVSVQSGSSTYSVCGAALRGQPDGAAEPIVLVDMPDHLMGWTWRP